MRPEITLICLLAKTNPTADDLETVRSIISDEGDRPDWAYFLDQCYRHRVLALVAHNLDRHALFGLKAGVPGRDLYRAHLLYQRARNDALLRELRVLLEAFQQADLRVVPRKGAYLSWAVYPDPELRPMGDLDLLVSRDCIAEAEALLATLGYAPGTLSDSLRTVEPLDRASLAFWRLHTSNAPPHFRLTSTEQVQAYSVDLVHNLFLPRSGFSLPAEEFLSQASVRDYHGAPFWVLPPELHLVDIAAHLFKESTTVSYINVGRHQSLSQFRDLAELVAAHAETFDWKLVLRTVREHEIDAPVYFALAHLNAIYDDVVPGEVLGELQDVLGRSAPELLDEYGAVDLNQPVKWRKGFLDRMFEPERVRLAEQSRSLV